MFQGFKWFVCSALTAFLKFLVRTQCTLLSFSPFRQKFFHFSSLYIFGQVLLMINFVALQKNVEVRVVMLTGTSKMSVS